MLRTCLALSGIFLASSLSLVGAGIPQQPIPSAQQTASARSKASVRKITTVAVDPETGKLVRVRPGAIPGSSKGSAAISRRIAKAREAAKQTPDIDKQEIHGLIDDTAKRHGVDPALVHSVVRVESNYQQKAISPKGAQGLMQLIPETAHRYGVSNAFEPGQNLEGGVRYLKYLTNRFDGDLRLALAAYNAGEGAVDRFGGIPPYRETQQYVTKVTGEFKARGGKTSTPPGPAARQSNAVEIAAATEASPSALKRQTTLRTYTDADGRLHIETVFEEESEENK